MKALYLTGAAALALVSAAPSFAQTAPAPAASEDAPGDIIVTAQKRSERLQDVPLAVTVVSGDAIAAQTGSRPELSTTGGTSDARFLSALCPTVEFGLLNATMHKLDEAVALDDLVALTQIYRDIIVRVAAL